jgi:hypothetical protein
MTLLPLAWHLSKPAMIQFLSNARTKVYRSLHYVLLLGGSRTSLRFCRSKIYIDYLQQVVSSCACGADPSIARESLTNARGIHMDYNWNDAFQERVSAMLL